MEIRKLTPAENNEQASLTRELIEDSRLYYSGTPRKPNILFDKQVDQLREMERISGFAYEGSPNYKVDAKVVSDLKEVRHEYPAKSLDKKKYADRAELAEFMRRMPGQAMFVSEKLDGNTLCLTYDDGSLVLAATRGDEGLAGQDVTHNALFIKGVPLHIPAKGHIVLRGEALMTFSDFEEFNAAAGGAYDNARNIVAGTVLMKDSNESRKRPLSFVAFELVHDSEKPVDAYSESLSRLKSWGFYTVPGMMVEKPDDVQAAIDRMAAQVEESDYPTDGLVFMCEDLKNGRLLGATGHHVRYAIALKWTDETKKTVVRDVEWSVGKTGAITPVACFDPVRLGIGSTITRASLANVSVARHTLAMDGHTYCTCGVGSEAEVYLANMIIPKIARATPGILDLPETCPVCGGKTVLRKSGTTEVLMCENPACGAKSLKKLAVYASKDGANIEGLSETTIAALVDMGLIEVPADFYSLKDHPMVTSGKLAAANGWGRKSVENLLAAIERSRTMDFVHFLYSLSVPLLGHDLSRKLEKVFEGQLDRFLAFMEDPAAWELTKNEGIGSVKAENLTLWASETLQDPVRKKAFERLLANITVTGRPEANAAAEPDGLEPVSGKTFVITGAVSRYKNRAEFKDRVEARGGKVASSVSKNTDYLVCNEASESSKSKKAKELNIPVITEDEFIARFGM